MNENDEVMTSIDIDVFCVCGERIGYYDEGVTVKACPDCGRKWRVEVAVEFVEKGSDNVQET